MLVMTRVKEEDIVFLSVSSFIGVAVEAVHYYGRLRLLQGGESIDITYKVTKAQAAKWGCGYRLGDKSTRFLSRRKVINAAKKHFKIYFPKAAVLVLGRSALAEPQEILVGPKEFKDKITKLAKRYARLDWDIEADREEIDEILSRWQEVWPRKYTSFTG